MGETNAVQPRSARKINNPLLKSLHLVKGRESEPMQGVNENGAPWSPTFRNPVLTWNQASMRSKIQLFS